MFDQGSELYYMYCISVHNAVVTCAVFAPSPAYFLNSDGASCQATKALKEKETPTDCDAEFVVSADFNGAIKVTRAT